MTYQMIYSSEATMPMSSDELEALLEHARRKNRIQGISGALVYADGMFLQIVEGERAKVHALMAAIAKDLRHQAVIVLREGEIPAARFSDWGMAYVPATPEQVAQWAGIGVARGTPETPADVSERLHRTAQFAQDLLVLLAPGEPVDTSREPHGTTEPGAA